MKQLRLITRSRSSTVHRSDRTYRTSCSSPSWVLRSMSRGTTRGICTGPMWTRLFLWKLRQTFRWSASRLSGLPFSYYDGHTMSSDREDFNELCQCLLIFKGFFAFLVRFFCNETWFCRCQLTSIYSVLIFFRLFHFRNVCFQENFVRDTTSYIVFVNFSRLFSLQERFFVTEHYFIGDN